MSESHPGVDRHWDDPDQPPEPEPGSSVFGPSAGPPSGDRRSYPHQQMGANERSPYQTQVQDHSPYAGGTGQPAYPETAPYRGQPTPYPDPSGYQGQPAPFPDPSGYQGQPAPYPDPSGYPGQVHVPAPPPSPGGPPDPQPDVGGPPRHAAPRRPRRRPPEHSPGRGSGIELPFGAGTVVGVAGLVCFLLGLVVLPWFTAGGKDATLSTIRTAFTVPETQPEDLPGGNAEEPSATGTDGVPSPGEVGDAVEDQVRDTAAEAAANAIDTGKARYLELYAEKIWIAAAIAVSLAVVFSTILTPRSFAMSLLLGFRRLSGFVTVLAGAAHGAALWIVFTGDGAPNPALGVWLSVGGLAAVLVGCILGPKN